MNRKKGRNDIDCYLDRDFIWYGELSLWPTLGGVRASVGECTSSRVSTSVRVGTGVRTSMCVSSGVCMTTAAMAYAFIAVHVCSACETKSEE